MNQYSPSDQCMMLYNHAWVQKLYCYIFRLHIETNFKKLSLVRFRWSIKTNIFIIWKDFKNTPFFPPTTCLCGQTVLLYFPINISQHVKCEKQVWEFSYLLLSKILKREIVKYKKWNNATLLTDFLKKYFFLKEYVIHYSRYEFSVVSSVNFVTFKILSIYFCKMINIYTQIPHK